MRIAVLDRDKCKPKDCGYQCMKACPRNRAGDECITVGEEDQKPIINEELCIGCGICVKKCPLDAITIVNLPESLKEQCLHQYGKNGFLLFRSPIPIPNQVVGLLGQNGTGKTTALQILANDLKPNLGTTEIATKEQLVSFFAGSELMGYFSDIENMKIAYKPQHVESIPSNFDGKVSELLKKADERKIFDKIVKELNLTNCLDNKVSDISGGELQKMAIAATMMKDASVYFFDEPSSYLDVKERLNIAKSIRKLAKEKLVLVVEHDLIVLDYLADLTHVFYGKPAAYGIVSFPKGIRIGINEYLKGFLKEENVRFRDDPIKFIVKTAKEDITKSSMVTFKDLSKEFEHFKMKVEEGEIYNQEIIGALGPNAIGKTTFMKMLAGELKSDSGEVSQNLKISYKPQYVKFEKDNIVRFLLQKADNRIITELSLDALLDKQLSKLSGGELQRVAIAESLSKEADLYLLDEPSAHLDVEQRVKVASVLRRFIDESGKSAIVIDHDLMFLDYISDRLMVFLGEPGKKGTGKGPFPMQHGMNMLLKDLDITFRRDEETGRPRANKLNSTKDREMKEKGQYYYVK